MYAVQWREYSLIQLWKIKANTILSCFGIHTLEREEVCKGKDGVGREEEAGKANEAVPCSLEIHLREIFSIARFCSPEERHGGSRIIWFGGSLTC